MQKQEYLLNKDEYNSDVSIKEKRVVVRIKKTHLIAILFIVVLSVVGLTLGLVHINGSRISIEEIWKRNTDDNSQMSGMVVKIIKNNGNFKGEIIELPTSASYFEVGQIKWDIISKQGKNEYLYRDLTGGDGSGTYSYSEESVMKLSEDGNTLFLDTFWNNAGAEEDLKQIWDRVKEK